MEGNADTSEFPIYNLDYVSLNEIYKNLKMVDIFELSFTTPEVKNTLREASVPVLSIAISFNSECPSIHLKSLHSELLWSFGHPDKVDFVSEAEYNIRQFKFRCKRSEFGYHTEHFDAEHGMLAVIRYLVTIFNCSDAIIEELSIDLGVIEDCRSVCEQFTKFKSVERLAILQTVDIERNRLNFAQNFDWVMNNLKIQEMYLGVELLEHKMVRNKDGEFDIRSFALRLDKVLKLNHICLVHADWFKLQDLLDLDVETAILGENSLDASDLNAFMKHWLNSTSNKLCWLEVRIGRGIPKDVYVEGLNSQVSTYVRENTKCSCPYRRFDSLKSSAFEFPTDSREITRADGAIATVSITRNTFFFHIKNDGPITPPVQPEDVVRALQERIRALMVERREINELMRADELGVRYQNPYPEDRPFDRHLARLRGQHNRNLVQYGARVAQIENEIVELRIELRRNRPARAMNEEAEAPHIFEIVDLVMEGVMEE